MIAARLKRVWPQLRTALWWVAVLVALRYGTGAWRAYRRAQTMRQAWAFFDASNPARVRAGLCPVTPAYKLETCEEAPDDDELLMASVRDSSSFSRYAPFVSYKTVVFDPDGQQPVWEMEQVRLRLPEPDTGQYTPPVSPGPWRDTLVVLRRYDYRAAARGAPPWTIVLGREITDFGNLYPNDRHLTVAQMDSVLRYWRTHSGPDSLADLRIRQRHPNRR